MKKKTSFLFALLLILASFAHAQTCDPWIVKAYKEYYQRNPTASECNIKNYNNGSWSSYEELQGYVRKYGGDPFIYQAYNELLGRRPNDWELTTQLYNKGSWSDYASLKRYVQEYQQSIGNNGLVTKTGPYNGNVAVGFFINGQQVAVNVVAPGGANVVAAGGANAVAAGGANVVAAGGANVVAAGGGNIVVSNNMAAVRIGEKFTAQSAGTKVIPASGSGALIIR